MPWEEVRERLRYHRGAAYDPAAEFVFRLALRAPARRTSWPMRGPASRPAGPCWKRRDELMERIHADFEYEPEATDVSTPALEALQMRQGVCQDFAHVMLACLRSLGLPARYVSGYLLTEPPPGKRAAGGQRCVARLGVAVPARQGRGRRQHGPTWTPPTTARPAKTTSRWPPAATTPTSRPCAACCMAAPTTSCMWR